VLHAVWDDGLVIFGYRGRVLDRKTVESFASTLFIGLDEQQSNVLELAAPGRRGPLEVHSLRIEIHDATEAFLQRAWVPWRSLSPSLAWFARAARLSQDVATAGLVLPSLTVDADGHGAASWQPVINDQIGGRLADLTRTMPTVVGALRPGLEPWQITSMVTTSFTDDAVRLALADTPVADPSPNSRDADDVVARRFLGALAARDSTVGARSPAEHAALQHLAQSLTRWTSPGVGRSATSDMAVMLRVVEPNDLDIQEGNELADLDPEELPWLVEMVLSPLSDPSLLLAAADVLEDSSKAALLHLTPAEVERAINLAKRRVVRAAPSLAAALADDHATTAALPLADIITFLRADAARLELAKVRVLLPTWWAKKPRTKVQGTAKPSDAAVTPGGLDVASIVTVDWQVALDGEKLTSSELTRLAAAKQELVYIRNKWVRFDPDSIAQVLTALTRVKRERSTLSAIEVVQVGADADLEVSGEGWVEELLAGLPDDRITPLPEPEGFVGNLRPYQQRGLGWLAFLQRIGLGGCLADDMGLGKTAQLLALLAHERQGGAKVWPTLVVCPLSVVRNWETESARFTPGLKVLVLHGPGRPKGEELAVAVKGHDLVVTTYATATRDVAALAAIRWDRLVADEAQNVKNPGTTAARALRRIPARQKVALTGTPVENRLSELWAVCDLVNPGLLGNATKFRQHFAVPIERNRDVEKTDELRAMVQPFMLRRSKADRSLVPDLPPKLEQVAYATLTKEQATLYQSVVDVLLSTLDHLDGIDRRGAILAAITRLKQICNHPAHYLADGSVLAGRSGKLARFDELVGDLLDADEKMLVFTQYREMGLILARHLREHLRLDVPFLHGGVSKTKRDNMVDQFQEGAGGPILLVSLKAGGSGLNLTAASQVVHYDRWWNPAVENQASDRAWRIGQTRTVLVHKMVCQGTVEERIDALIEGKKDLADRVVGSGEGWITELTTSEIRDLLVLR
jgi:SNF2-related domain/SNF2 Helicase protein/Helicase conserved C-terminal domain